VAEFAVPTDVVTAYEGSLPGGADSPRLLYLLSVVSARLRRLMPTLEDRMADDADLALMAKDVVVQAVIRRLPGSVQQTSSETQTSGPWSVTTRYTTDSSQTFSDDDLALLSDGAALGLGGVGSIRTGRPDWSMQ
jgi:hypothetical protein